jgi:hypothetical protein
MKALAGWVCFAVLLGIMVGFRIGGGPVDAQSVDNKTNRWLAGTLTYGQSADCFVLFDSQKNRLLVYTVTGNKKLELVAVREVSWDLKPVSYGKQTPLVQEMKSIFEKSLKEGK